MRFKNEMDIDLDRIKTIAYYLRRIKDLQLYILQLTKSPRFIKIHKIFTNVLERWFLVCE
jgi:hypothetical protein